MATKPLIGLTTTLIPNSFKNPAFSVNEPYQRSISTAGGLPVLIPHALVEDDLDALLIRLDGILFTGGDDIDPHRYGSSAHRKVKGISTQRDSSEIHLLQVMLDTPKPFLGICRGLQVINVAMGGSLYEDLNEQFAGALQHDNHRQPRDYLAHPVELEVGSYLEQILGTSQVQVNSLHHQGIHRLASNLRATGSAPDGLIEAIELPRHPFGVAVQWHPEELQEHETMRRLFRRFVQACQES